MAAKTLRHFVRYFFGLDAPQTQTTEAERAALSRHAAGARRLAEIGVYEGFTTALLVRTMAADGVLYAIDPFFAGRLGICWSKWIASREVGRTRPPRRVIFIEKLSYEAVLLIEEQLDFIFIDGDHSLEGIRRDWTDWAPRICPNGIMALHDTRVPVHNPEVAKLGSVGFFEEHICKDPRFMVVEQVDSLSVLRRTAGI